MDILLAVSGGIDSMYLANRAPEFFPGARFVLAHCNFTLRGEESDSDEAFVRQWCSDNGMEFVSTRFDTSLYASENGISIEMAARDLRYAWFLDLCRERGLGAVAVAHNANDNAETLLLNLLRGTGSRGMRGMEADSALLGSEIRLLRPMLGTDRAAIRKWMEAEGRKWREDRTNAENDCKRNKIRNQVFPLFEEINPSFLSTLSEDMSHLRQTDNIAEDYFQQAAQAVISPRGILVRPLMEMKHWKYVLWRLLEPYSLSRDTFGKMTDLLERWKNAPSGTVTLSSKSFEGHGCRLKFVTVNRPRQIVLVVAGSH